MIRWAFGHFLEEYARVDDHAVADDAGLVRVEDARGNDVEDVLLAVDHQGMAGIVAALEADHVVRVPGQQIDDLALALITPLGADHHHTGHVLSLIA
jgi:acetyl-CoA acetyltransferase